jgi:sulfite reductase (NADPH) flavoprotein alpha-component
MSIPFMPDSAPFSTPQRAWLNGFFAGLFSASQSATAAPAAPPKPPEEQFPWHDSSLSLDARMKLAEGKPPARQLMAAMAQLDCGACGYVCKTYGEAIAETKEKDLTKCTPGGKETAAKLKELVALHIKGKDASAVAPPAPTPIKYDRNHPFLGRFVGTTPLNAEGSDKDTRHVIIDIKGSGMTYKAGDAMGVFVENCPQSVQMVINLLHTKGAEDVPGLDQSHISLREALTRDYTITRPTAELLELLIKTATEDDEVTRLKALESGDALDGYEIVDLLLQFRSARPKPADFVSTLAPLQPRLYSISSSPRLHPDEVHLTVGVVQYTNPFGRACNGVASTHLAHRMQSGQRLRVYINPSHQFSLPTDGEVPILMVGPGTGIAPFRAFLQERKASGARGINWLFFGDQHSATDFLYRDELEGWQREGHLTRLDTAFSRDQDQKVYVQHRMLENAREIWSWLEAGACIYVCGDAKRMAKDVDEALARIIADHGCMTSEGAKTFLASLAKNRRYQRDVY